MKKTLTILIITMALLSSTMLSSQTTSKGDTLLVGPLNSAGKALGALNEAIKADTNATTGERLHKVYKLERKEQYILTETIRADFPLVIVADPPDDNNRLPIIRCGLKKDGSSVNRWWHLFNDATFKNIWMSGVTLDGKGGIDWISQEVSSTEKRICYDGCIIEFPYTGWGVFADWGLNNTYIMTNCIFQYIGNPTGTTWNGAIFATGIMDSVIHRNNTFFDFGCFAANSQNFYLEFDHCTFVNSVVHPINSHTHVIGKYTNNLFVNCHAFSDDYDEIRRHHDVEVKGLMNYAEIQWDKQTLDTLYKSKMYDPNGDGHLTEGEIVWELKNNVWWYTQPIKDYWAQFAQVVPNPWMNNYNKAMFASSDSTEKWTWDLKTYKWADSSGNIIENPSGGFDTLTIVDSTVVPQEHEPFKFFVEENTMNVDPGIKNMNNTDELLAQNSINIRTEWAGGTITDPVKWHNVDNYLAFTWPLNYDLGYTNTSLENAGTDGKPIGSLQWWDQYNYAIKDKKRATPNAFTLEQNYPNPFNPSTVIPYSIDKKATVQLKVYNILGAEVATLVNKSQLAGDYAVSFDATNLTSGIYFYQLKIANQTITRKMMVMK